MARNSRRIHITGLGSSAARDVDRLSPDGYEGMLALARQGAGGRYAVTASRALIYARHDALTGGRDDDAARARELTRVLGDDSVAALVTIRGGAWFTRILDRVNFEVLRRRRTRIYLFGFSEMTTLVNIAGQYDSAVAMYDMGPTFLFAAGQRYALRNFDRIARNISIGPKKRKAFATGWALARFPTAFADFFRDVADILDGQGSSRVSTGRVLQGRLPKRTPITIVGGTLSVILPLLASKYAPSVDTRGKWLALEDVNEDVDPIDRMMAALQLAGHFERAAGVILGNFHKGDYELSERAFHILRRHLPARRQLPVVALDTFGHVDGMAPLPMHREVILRRTTGRGIQLEAPWAEWAKPKAQTIRGRPQRGVAAASR